MKNFIHSKVIAAVRNCEEFENAVKSKSEIIFHLSPDINTVAQIAEIAHSNGKKHFIHLDLAMGLGKDKSGIMYAKNVGVDGIITTRVNIVKIARDCGLFTVQRFFIVDSHSVNTTVESVFASKADMIEIMPGTVTKVIKKLRRFVDVPVIAGGLIDTDNEIKDVIANGAAAVSTSNQELWDL